MAMVHQPPSYTCLIKLYGHEVFARYQVDRELDDIYLIVIEASMLPIKVYKQCKDELNDGQSFHTLSLYMPKQNVTFVALTKYHDY